MKKSMFRRSFCAALSAAMLLGVCACSGGTDIGGNAFEGHDGGCTGGFGDFCLFRGGHIHDDSTFKHLGEILVEFVAVLFRHVNLLESGCFVYGA